VTVEYAIWIPDLNRFFFDQHKKPVLYTNIDRAQDVAATMSKWRSTQCKVVPWDEQAQSIARGEPR
jgi:hypothetical protein